ncbi:uncharacterized protein KY384_002939 [Bacidia gigantensis]|uniref:uncharacterized protein n=1 Tax=Bacidia gigantensis TaxID=2732470 RepID=UPI001D052929|nr:uncharacterized protein KY384_002939 [Bacidia gigantensis]KAG8531311.1 hypothetical protein KY384_002939 [Bacidia gigantensis]
MAAIESRMIEMASRAGALLAFEPECLIVPQLVPGVPAPNAVALKPVATGETDVGDVAVSVTTAGEAEELGVGTEDWVGPEAEAEAEERMSGQKESLQVLTSAKHDISMFKSLRSSTYVAGLQAYMSNLRDILSQIA